MSVRGGETAGLGDVLFASGTVAAYRGDVRKRAVGLGQRERAEHEVSEIDRFGSRGVRGFEVALSAQQQGGGPVQPGHIRDGPGVAGRDDGPAIERVRLGDLVGDHQAEQRRASQIGLTASP